MHYNERRQVCAIANQTESIRVWQKRRCVSNCIFGNPSRIDPKVIIHFGEKIMSSFWIAKLSMMKRKKLIQTCQVVDSILLLFSSKYALEQKPAATSASCM